MRRYSSNLASATPSLLLWVLSACGGRAPAAAPPSGGAFAFDYVLEATIFKIDVVHVNLQIDSGTVRTVKALVSSGNRTRALEDSVGAALMETPTANARLTFLVAIPAQQFVENTAEILRDMGEEGLLASSEVEHLVRSSRQRFAFLDEAGIAPGDYVEQVLRGDSVTTTFITSLGERRLHDIQVGREHRIALLGSYFAKTSDFRDGLLDQVFGIR